MWGKNSLVSLGPIAEFSPAFTARKEFGRAVNAMVLQSKFGGPEFKSRPCPDQVPTLSRFVHKISSFLKNLRSRKTSKQQTASRPANWILKPAVFDFD